ncbi:hypothetical protein AURDEDRAFT_130746 [Auricularia subglabra TFB-10046 SS5]|nr:hypothetical protein AURDEDRAFT_130746 [Auricularia subglabra TFB-10046 SS5]
MRFGLPESPEPSGVLGSLSFTSSVPMPGAYPLSPPAKAPGFHTPARWPVKWRDIPQRGAGFLEPAAPPVQVLRQKEVISLVATATADRAETTPVLGDGQPTHSDPKRSNYRRFVYVGNLPGSVGREEIFARFSRLGKLKSSLVSCCRGYPGNGGIDLPNDEYMATIEFAHATHAARAVRKYNGTKWAGRTIVVSFNPWDMPTGRRIRGERLANMQSRGKSVGEEPDRALGPPERAQEGPHRGARKRIRDMGPGESEQEAQRGGVQKRMRCSVE